MFNAVVDFPSRSGHSVRRSFDHPVEVLIALKIDDVTRVVHDAFAAARDGQWVVGYVSYEAAPAFDSALVVRGGAQLPLAAFGLFDNTAEAADSLESRACGGWELEAGFDEWTRAVESIREYIAAGRTYQVNLTTRARSLCGGVADAAGPPTSDKRSISELASHTAATSDKRSISDARALYEHMHRAQGSGYHALLNLDDHSIISASPELFFEVRGRTITSRPMKGTRRRGLTLAHDARLAEELGHSEKDRAENLMIVDLIRNDIGRVARMGSVRVTDLYCVETYNTVLQMTSTVTGELGNDCTGADVFRALFPCGSVTGAPKVTAMQVISELETSPREVYCGAIGVIQPGGDCTFNVAIRTIRFDRRNGEAEYGVGAGITWDSSAEAEYDEIRTKSAILSDDTHEFDLIETMRLDHTGIPRLLRHLARLRNSCEYFGIPYRASEIANVVDTIAATKPGDPQRLRLLVSRDGSIRHELSSFDETAEPLRIGLADGPVQSTNRFLYHKTTRRPHTADVLLYNENGFVTEFTRGNIVADIDGRLVTPPVPCGLLSGTLREELIENGTIHERIIHLNDLARANRVWMINSLRGWVDVELV